MKVITTHWAILASCLAALLCAGNSHAACTKDTECKGDRICEQGVCTNPGTPSVTPAPVAPAPVTPAPAAVAQGAAPAAVAQGAAPAAVAQGAAPAALAPAEDTEHPPTTVAARYTPTTPPPAGPFGWHRGYVELGTPLVFHGWGGVSNTDSVKISGSFSAGIRAAGYFATRKVHVGGYISYISGGYSVVDDGYYYSPSEGGNFSTGLALKFGGPVGRRVWLGCAIDPGLDVFHGEAFGWEKFIGFRLYTGLVVDVLAVGSGPFKFGVTSRLGTDIQPYASHSGLDGGLWLVRLGLTVGVTFGGGR